MDKKRTGIKARQKSIQINFTWNKKRYFETLNLNPTETNLTYAATLRKRITQEIDLEVFDPNNYASDYPHWNCVQQHAENHPITQHTFAEVAELYLSKYEHKKTRNGYRDALNRTWLPLFDTPIEQIEYSHILYCAQSLDGKSAKHYNNERLPLLGTFKLAKKLKWITENPAEELEAKKNQRAKPDPFTQDEANQIIEHFYSKYGEQYAAYVETGFFTGLRHPSEIIALTHEKINTFKGNNYARIDQRKSLGKIIPGTKTGIDRDVFLMDRSLSAIRRMKKYSEQSQTPEYVFINPETNQAYYDGSNLNDKWTTTLKRLGIRHRKMYNMRHTYATLMLEQGLDPADAADELGHSIKMFLEVYAAFITRSKRAEKMNKINESISPLRATENKSVPQSVPRRERDEIK